MKRTTSVKAWIFYIFFIMLLYLFASSFGDLGGGKKAGFNRHKKDKSSALVGVVKVEGVILSSGKTIKELLEFDERDDIDFIALRLNTPGGAVAPSQEIYDTITGLKKKVVISMGTVAASGGYYIASAGDLVYANRGTITGSIGVIANYADLSELYSFLKFKPWSVKSGKFKDAGSEKRAPSEDDKEYLKEVVMELFDQFVADIAKGRKLPEEKILAVADGKVFTGAKALDYKLIDGLGTFNMAVKSGLSKWEPDKKEFILTYPEKKRDFYEIIDKFTGGLESIRNKAESISGFYYLNKEIL